MDTGGKIRTGKILEQLAKNHDITLISNFEQNKDSQHINEIKKLCSKFIPVHWEEIGKYTPLFFIRLFIQMFSLYPVSALNDYSSVLRKTLEREVNNNHYDLAICDFVQSSLMFKNIKGTATLLFQHNVESIILRRHVERAKNPVSRLFWWLQWGKMFLYEKKMCHAFNKVIVVSDEDKTLLDNLYGTTNTVTIPTGVDINYYTPRPRAKETPNSLVFCGSMDWLPNEDAIDFFIDEILPLLKKEIPDISLTIVGRNPSQAMQKKADKNADVILTGWVKDTRPYLSESSLVIVPIRIGGGTRMKIFEAMAMEKAVVSTTLGAEGLPVTDRENIVVADNAATFAIAIKELLLNEEKKEKISKNARNHVEWNFNWQNVASVFSNILETTIGTNDTKEGLNTTSVQQNPSINLPQKSRK